MSILLLLWQFIVSSAGKSSFALKAERRRRREEQMKQHQGVGKKDNGMVLSIQKVSSLDESSTSSCQSPVTNSNPQLTRWLMEQKRLQAERLSSHSSSRPTKLDATSDRESPTCYHDDSEDSSLGNSYTGSRGYKEVFKAQSERDTPPELLRRDSSNSCRGSWKRRKSVDESKNNDEPHHTPKYQQEPSQDFPDHYGNQMNLSMDVQPSQLTNTSLPSSAAVLEGSLGNRGVSQYRTGSGKMKKIMEHEPSPPPMIMGEPIKKEYHYHGNKEGMSHIETKSSRDAVPVQMNMKSDVQMLLTLQQQQLGKANADTQSDSDTVIDGDGSQDDIRKILQKFTVELQEKKLELVRFEQERADEERKLALEEQRYTEQEIKDDQMAFRPGQQMSVEISRKRRRRELQRRRDEASEHIQLLEFDKQSIKTKILVLEKKVQELKMMQDQKMTHDQKMVVSHERTGSHDQRMEYQRMGSHDERMGPYGRTDQRMEYQRMGSHDERMGHERTGSHDQRMEYQRMGSHDERMRPYERTGSHDQKRGRSRPSSAQSSNKERSHDPPVSPRFPYGVMVTNPKLRGPVMPSAVTTDSSMISRHIAMATRTSPINMQQNISRASVRGTIPSPYKELDNNLSRKKSRSRDLEEITSLSNKSVSEAPSPYQASMVTRDHTEDRYSIKSHEPSSLVVRKDSVRNKPKSLFMSTTTLNDQPQQSQRSNQPIKSKPTSYQNSRPHNNACSEGNSLATLERTLKSPVSSSTTPTTPTFLRQGSTNGGRAGRHAYSKSEVDSTSVGDSIPHSYSRMEQEPTRQHRSELAKERSLLQQLTLRTKQPSNGNHDYQAEEESSDETFPRRDIGESPAAPDVIPSTFTSTSYNSTSSPGGGGSSASTSPELPAGNLYSPGAPPIASLTLTCSQQYSPPSTPFQQQISPLVKPPPTADHQLPWEQKQPFPYKQQRSLSPWQQSSWDHQTHPIRMVAKDTTHPGRLYLPSNRRTPVQMYAGTDL